MGSPSSLACIDWRACTRCAAPTIAHISRNITRGSLSTKASSGSRSRTNSCTQSPGFSVYRTSEALPNGSPCIRTPRTSLCWSVPRRGSWRPPVTIGDGWSGLRDGGRRLYGDPPRPAGSGRRDHGLEDPLPTLKRRSLSSSRRPKNAGRTRTQTPVGGRAAEGTHR